MKYILPGLVALGIVACTSRAKELPSSTQAQADGDCYACSDYGFDPGECWEGWQCDRQGKCLSYVGTPDRPDSCPPACVPTTCAAQGATCGSISDGCRGTLSCGDCSGADTCGGGGVANQCGHPACVPVTCASKAGSCGTLSDGCGGTVDCGPCPVCGVPAVVPATGGVVYGATSGASTYSSSCGGASAPEEYFAWTPSMSGPATASTCGSSFDTVVDVITDTCPSGNLLTCNDNGAAWCYGSTTYSLADFDVTAGTTYYFAVDGAGAASGNVTLKVVSPGGTCSQPFELPSTGGSFSSAFNGTNPGDRGSCATAPGAARVHHFVPANSGTATVKLTGDFWPATLYVRSGSCGGGEIACTNQTAQWPTETLSVAVTAGTEYFIWVSSDTDNSDTVVMYTLNVTAP